MSFDRFFRSDRLAFRAISTSAEDKAFMRDSMLNDPTTYVQSTSRLLVPPREEDIDSDMSRLGSSLLAVVICLPNDNESADGMLAVRSNTTKSGSVPKAVSEKSDQRRFTTVGWLTLDAHVFVRHHRTCNLGVMIAAPYQAKGFGTEAINWALDWAFGVAGMHAVRLSCFSFNVRAMKLYERLGFVKEGQLRESYYLKSQWHDRIFYSILEKEWASLRAS
jgi:RimJ/RimL family protein N-acetyltransferase